MQDDLNLVGCDAEGALSGVDFGEEGGECVIVCAVGGSNGKADVKLGNVSMFLAIE